MCRARDILHLRWVCICICICKRHCGAERLLTAARFSFLVHYTDCLGRRAEAKSRQPWPPTWPYGCGRKRPVSPPAACFTRTPGTSADSSCLANVFGGVGEHYAIGASEWSHRASPWLLWPSVSCSLCGLILSDAVREQSLKRPCARYTP